MKKLIIFAGIAMLSLSGCDKIKDATSKDIKVKGVKFDFTAVVTDDGVTKAGGIIKTNKLLPFGGTKEVNIDDFKNQEVKDNKDKIKGITIESLVVSATTVPNDGYTVTDLKIEAPGVTGSPQVISTYKVGEPYTTTTAMNNFVEAFVEKVLKENVSVTVSGKIDAPENTIVKVTIECDIVFKVNLL